MKSTLLSALTFILAAGTASGQIQNPSEVLREIFTGSIESIALTEQMAAAVTPRQLENIVSSVKAQFGDFREVRGTANPYSVVLESGTVTTNIYLDESGRLAGIQFTQMIPAVSGMPEALNKLESLEGNVSYYITKNNTVLAEKSPEEALAVGSAFKLAVLAALIEAVQQGRLSWDQVVQLQQTDRSLPTGILQNWPAGSALTVESLASLMISISDNTATDALIRIVGREAVEKFAPESRPFLTTREAFILKNPENSDLKDRYLSATTAGRRRILRQLEGRNLPPEDLFAGGRPVSPQIEWFLSTERLCELIEQTADLELTTINPGVASQDEWARVSFKGGSEPGIINLTTRLVAEDGTAYCISVSQNTEDGSIDQSAFISAYQGILSTLKE